MSQSATMPTTLAAPAENRVARGDFLHEDPDLFRKGRTWVVLLTLFVLSAGNGFFSEQPRFTYNIKTVKALSEASPILGFLTFSVFVLSLGLIAGWAKPTIRQMLRQKPVLAFSVLAFVSTLWSQLPDQSFRKAMFLTVTMLFAWYFTSYYSPPDQVRLTLAAGVFVGLLCIVWVLLLPQYGVSYSGEWKGIFGQKNLLGSSIFFLFSGLLFRRIASRRQLIALLVQSILPVGLLYMSKSRTSWILVIVLLAVRVLGPMVVQVRRETMPFLLFGSIVGGAMAVGGLAVLLNFLGRDLTLTGRTHEWEVIFPFALTHFWFGYGYQAFWTGTTGDSGRVAAMLHAVTTVADNGYLDLMLQFGIVGLTALLVVLVTAIREFLRLLRRGFIPLIAFWYLGLILALFVGSWTEGMFWMPTRIIPFMFVLACAGLKDLNDFSSLNNN